MTYEHATTVIDITGYYQTVPKPPAGEGWRLVSVVKLPRSRDKVLVIFYWEREHEEPVMEGVPRAQCKCGHAKMWHVGPNGVGLGSGPACHCGCDCFDPAEVPNMRPTSDWLLHAGLSPVESELQALIPEGMTTLVYIDSRIAQHDGMNIVFRGLSGRTATVRVTDMEVEACQEPKALIALLRERVVAACNEVARELGPPGSPPISPDGEHPVERPRSDVDGEHLDQGDRSSGALLGSTGGAQDTLLEQNDFPNGEAKGAAPTTGAQNAKDSQHR